MKINFIAKLSIIFYFTNLLGADKEQVISKVISYTKDQKTPPIEYILSTFEDKRLQVDTDVIKRFKNKPEKLNIPFESIISFSDPSVNFSLQFEGSVSQNLETVMDTKENKSQTQSLNDDLKSAQNNNK